MLGSVTANLGQPLARLSSITTGSFPSLQLRQAEPPEASLDLWLQDVVPTEPQQQQVQRLIKQSMDAELWQSSRRRSSDSTASTALATAFVKQIAAYAVTQSQRELIRAPLTIGYG
jgi:hypothetical protein